MRYLLLLCALLICANAEFIKAYRVDIAIAGDGSLLVREQIDYDFDGAHRHGIYRDIPIMVQSARGSWDIGLNDFKVSIDGEAAPFVISRASSKDAGPMVHFRIGNPHTTVTGVHRYIIMYSVAQGISGMADGRDAIRWNAVGTGWNVPIHHVSVLMKIPPQLQGEEIEPATYSGRHGSAATGGTIRRLSHDFFEATISKLEPQEGFTVELAYAADLLTPPARVGTQWIMVPSTIWQWYALLLFVMSCLVVWWRYGKETPIGSISPQYEPPKEMTALRAGLLIDQSIDNRDFTAAIVELAQRGYLEVHKDEVLVRTDKSTRDLPHELRILLEEALFNESNRFDVKKRSGQRGMHIWSVYQRISTDLYKWAVAKAYFVGDPQKKRRMFIGFGLLAAVPLIGFSVYETMSMLSMDQLFSILFIAIPATTLIVRVFSAREIVLRSLFSTLLFFVVFFVFSIYVFHVVGKIPWGWQLLLYPFPLLLMVLVPLSILSRYMGKYKPKGAELYRELAGYREFMKRVERDEIARRLKDDPLFLERGLPYAMVFGLTKHWLSFYDLAHVPAPDWYDGESISSIGALGSSLGSIADNPSSGSGGGSSGGGSSSGGGGGGGGGGSW